jgi:hypothetical protein
MLTGIEHNLYILLCFPPRFSERKQLVRAPAGLFLARALLHERDRPTRIKQI